ncbi:hypothetical protein BHMPCIPO_06268 [Ensifer sesbaniae]|nr:hypothetical protein [Ensifer sesbaniae]
MSKALSMDLRVRVLAAVGQGLSHRAAAERFGVSAASISRWRSREREQGDARPKALGGDRRSGRIDAHMSVIVEALGRTLPWKRYAAVWRIGVSSSASGRSSVSSSGTTSRAKKSAHASEQNRPDILKRRQDWFDGQLDLDPERLVFIDETWASTDLAPICGTARVARAFSVDLHVGTVRSYVRPLRAAHGRWP